MEEIIKPLRRDEAGDNIRQSGRVTQSTEKWAGATMRMSSLATMLLQMSGAALVIIFIERYMG